MSARRRVGLVLALCGSVLANAATAPANAASRASEKPGNWPGFRGSGAIGHATRANPPTEWSGNSNKNVRWKAKVPRPGMNSPVVWEGRLFLTGADESGREMFCFDTDTGALLWRHDVRGIPGVPPDEELPDVMETSGLAAPTVTTDGQHVAALFATGELVCTDVNGRRVWAKHLGVPKNHYGHASSLIHHENRLFVQFDQQTSSALLAFDLALGKLVWEAKRGPISWSSPILVTNKGRLELILTNCKTVDSYDPKTGKLLWQIETLAGEVAASPAFADGTVYVASEGAVAAAIDVSNHAAKPKVRWTWGETLPDVSSPVANERYVIIPSGHGVVTCLDAKTGKKLWEHEFSAGFYSAPILVNDRVYILDLAGGMQIFRMSDKFELLGVSKIGEATYATPAFVGDRIYIRGATHLFCVGAESK
ncbi:MAG TPA: PQQ-binding-like beta-propeller repeat protein [Methylomirabilota bacterium]|nr:PQQ-binding-like beta-propeller repeat protein [Methylomirabilota bacterium]